MSIFLSPGELYARGGILDVILDNTFDASILVDKEGKLLYASRGAGEFLGIPPENLTGKHILELVKLSGIVRVIETGKPEYGSILIYNGQKCIVNMFPVFFANNEVIGALGTMIFRDISSLKRVLSNLAGNSDNTGDYYDIVARKDAVYTLRDFIGQSGESKRIMDECRLAAPTPYPVLIFGETGTGKEILANGIHSENPYTCRGPIIKINCSAIPHDLLESELFGYEKGAFTGAVTAKKGKFELAENGSILLDEIGDMDINLQGKLLRVIEEKEFERIGGVKLIPLKARIIASTNRDLKKLCEKGSFRKDLYYRLSSLEIHIPPLRERKTDIPLLISHFAVRNGQKICFSQKAMETLLNYDWPGNVREMKNIINRLAIMEFHETVEVQDICRILNLSDDNIQNRGELGRPLENHEREVIIKVLQETGLSISEAARRLKVTRSTLYKKIRKYHITVGKTVIC